MTGRVEHDVARVGDRAATYSPTATGAITSSRHCRTSVGVVTLREVGAVVGQERHAGEPAGDLGIGAAEAGGQLAPSSGRSGLPMITGAIALDQPR